MTKFLVVLFSIFILYSMDIGNKIKNYRKDTLYNEIISLEKKYQNKLLIAYDIDPLILAETCNITNYQEQQKCQKQYIMNKANLSEKEYEDIFVHPLQQLISTKETTIKELKSSYEKIKQQITDIDDVIDVISN